jgi:hypothetical protein
MIRQKFPWTSGHTRRLVAEENDNELGEDDAHYSLAKAK